LFGKALSLSSAAENGRCRRIHSLAVWVLSRHSQLEPLTPEAMMTQTTNRLFDDFAKLMTDAAGAAEGVRRETETLMRAQAEKFLRDMNVVTREDFEAVREMAQKARQENEALAARVAVLEAKLAK
jgi:BMFP domain-containing protein YqiC